MVLLRYLGLKSHNLPAVGEDVLLLAPINLRVRENQRRYRPIPNINQRVQFHDKNLETFHSPIHNHTYNPTSSPVETR